jgi:hypothetical protein
MWLPLLSASAQDPPETLTVSPAFQAIQAELGRSFGDGPRSEGVDPASVLVPVGVWIAVGPYSGFTYVHPTEGLSVGARVPVVDMFTDPPVTDPAALAAYDLRVSWRGPAFRELTPEERAARGLPARPEWLEAHGRQPEPGTLFGAWRLHPNLWGRSLAAWPDDVEVLFDDRPPHPEGWESMWVHIERCARSWCEGTVINEPFHLRSVKLGDRVRFSITSVGPTEYLLPKGVRGPVVRRGPMKE